jgi:hypothetical protein
LVGLVGLVAFEGAIGLKGDMDRDVHVAGDDVDDRDDVAVVALGIAEVGRGVSVGMLLVCC